MGEEKESGSGKTGIAWQNKDVVSKSLAEMFRGKSFAVYGVNVPEIMDIRPTNLPLIEARELRLDNLFLLADGSYAIVDYESKYDEANKQKYFEYVAQVEKRLYNEYGRYFPIRVIIIYTADVERRETEPVLELGGFRLSLTEAFLSEMDSEAVYAGISAKISRKEELADEDLMRLIIYPLTFKGDGPKQAAIKQVLDLLAEIGDEEKRRFVAKYLLVFTDKVIKADDADRVRRMLMLTKVEQIIENEKIEAVNQTRSEERERARKNLMEIVANLLRTGDSADKVSRCTGLSLQEVQAVETAVLQEA